MRRRQEGLDHRVGHLWPLSIRGDVLERLVLALGRYCCSAQKQQGVATP